MSDSYKIRYTTGSYKDLKEIFDFIEQDSPQNAPAMIARIIQSVDGLDILPHRYKSMESHEQLGTDIRSMVVHPFLVRYEIEESIKTVIIHSVRHGARDSER